MTHLISTVAGTGIQGLSGDGGPATAADLEPNAIAIDPEGNLYISSTFFNRVRRIDSLTGIITRVAGNGTRGMSGDGGPATQAELSLPHGLTTDDRGNLYIASAGISAFVSPSAPPDGRIRRVDTKTGLISSHTQRQFDYPIDVAIDLSGNLFVADANEHQVRRIEAGTLTETLTAGNGATEFLGDGGPATAAAIDAPSDLATDEAGNLYIAQPRRIRKISTNGVITTAASVSGGSLPFEVNVAADASGNLYVADYRGHRVLKVPVGTTGVETVAGTGSAGFAGDGGSATAAHLNYPEDVAVDTAGNLYIADTINFRVRRVDVVSGIMTTIAGNGESDSAGDGGPATLASFSPIDIEIDRSGALYIAEYARVRRIDPSTGTIQTVAGDGGFGFAGDGGPATAASICCSLDVAVDASGNLHIVDDTTLRVRRVDGVSGIIDTIAGSGSYGFSGDNGPATLARFAFYQSATTVDANGNLYIADLVNNRIRKVPPCGAVAEPLLRSPSSGSAGVSTFPPLQWSASPKAQRYDVLLGTSSPPLSVVASDVNVASFAPANLEPLTTYYWQVIARGDPFCNPVSTAVSEVRSFTTASGCREPAGVEGVAP